MYLKINIDGENTEAFSARSLDAPTMKNDRSKQIIEYSQKTYALPRKDVEDFIYGSNEDTLETIEELKSDEDFDAPMI